MNSNEFWAQINKIISDGFTAHGLEELDRYATDFITGRLIYKRFSPQEQLGCATGGYAHVVASIIAGAENDSDSSLEAVSDFKRQQQRGATQAHNIEKWARCTGCWIEDINHNIASIHGEHIAEGGEAQVYEHGATVLKTIGLDYFIEPILALDRISLYNAWFPETKMTVLGFGTNKHGDFKILVEQPFVEGVKVTDDEILQFMKNMGFELKNARNWTYATREVYLGDMHDENVIKSLKGTIFVIDCDIRINTPELRQGGTRKLSTEVEYE